MRETAHGREPVCCISLQWIAGELAARGRSARGEMRKIIAGASANGVASAHPESHAARPREGNGDQCCNRKSEWDARNSRSALAMLDELHRVCWQCLGKADLTPGVAGETVPGNLRFQGKCHRQQTKAAGEQKPERRSFAIAQHTREVYHGIDAGSLARNRLPPTVHSDAGRSKTFRIIYLAVGLQSRLW